MDPYKSLMPGSGHDMPDEPFISRNNNGLPTAWNIVQFYSSNSDPWVPKHTIPQETAQFSAKPTASFADNSGVPSGQYAPPRSNALYDYTISDSGYESRTKKSAENTSLFEGMDRSQDARSVTGRLADFHPFNEQFAHSPTIQRDYRQPWMHQSAPQESQPAPVHPTSTLVCPTCQKAVKNKSELKKHDQRHSKPHKCDIAGCVRKDGFSTVNDLDRHKKSVHSTHGTKFRCNLGACLDKEKVWPRSDNFRSHLKRVHNRVIEADGDLGEFMIGTSPPAAAAASVAAAEGPAYLEGVGSSLLDYASYSAVPGQANWYDQRATTDLDMSEASPMSLSVSFPNHQHAEVVQGADLAMAQSGSCIVPMDHATRPPLMASNSQGSDGSGLHLFDSGLSLPRKADSHPILRPLATTKNQSNGMVPERTQEQGPMVEPPRTTSGTLDSTLDDSSSSVATSKDPVLSNADEDQRTGSYDCDNTIIENEDHDIRKDEVAEEDEKNLDLSDESEPGKPDEAALFQMLSDVPPEILEKFLKDRKVQMSKKPKPAVAQAGEAQLHACDDCSKVFKRPCELKKHRKRHLKPYGCTFAKCTRQFGSKNDWKRHENSQHMQLETWKCHEPDGSSICGKVFSRREQFRNHLSSSHGLNDPTRVEKELHERRIGRNGDSSFWCGFCAAIVNLRKDPNSWTERFNHIDDHFCGRKGLEKRHISEWQHLGDSETVDSGSSSGPPVADSSLGDQDTGKREAAAAAAVLPDPVPTPSFNKKKRSAEEDLVSTPKRNKG